MNNSIEEKRSELNLDIRSVLSLLDMIHGEERKEYKEYIPNSMNEEEYLNSQIKLVKEIKEKFVSIFNE